MIVAKFYSNAEKPLHKQLTDEYRLQTFRSTVGNVEVTNSKAGLKLLLLLLLGITLTAVRFIVPT